MILYMKESLIYLPRIAEGGGSVYWYCGWMGIDIIDAGADGGGGGRRELTMLLEGWGACCHGAEW